MQEKMRGIFGIKKIQNQMQIKELEGPRRGGFQMEACLI
jgi:hypothetical protein